MRSPYLLNHLLTESASHAPDKAAVIFGSASITYEGLERASNQLASILGQSGIEKGDRVGIYLGKSIESVVAAFGILKAGAVYVPLDPGTPASRVAYIVGNCGMKALVGTPKNVEILGRSLPAPSPIRSVVLVEGEEDRSGAAAGLGGAETVRWKEVLRAPAGSPRETGVIEDDLAYILYTSGSTGEPKGVMISHRASLTFVDWTHACFGVLSTDRVSNHAPLHFDLSIFDIFTTIKAQATLLPVPETLAVFPVSLADFIEERRISIWYSVPSVLTRLVLHGNPGRYRFSSLRTILFAGEVFPVKYLRQLKDLVPHAEYYNLYGPTETNVCTFYRVQDIPPSRVEPFPIGKACSNTEVFAVNAQDEICARGEIGELCARGPGLMKGYWGMPDKTRAVLGPHPARSAFYRDNVYRTGDLVQEDENGDYIFLGRRDNMIKSRGYRIELGDIETALYGHPEVEEVAVIAIPDEQIGNLISALVVKRSASALNERDLEAFCSQRIPKYMIPGVIEFRSSLPKTSTGKVDRTSLLNEHLRGSSG